MSTTIESSWENDRLKEEIESLRKQLAAHIKREVMLRDAVNAIWDNPHWKPHGMPVVIVHQLQEALAATADLDGLILCEKEPCRDDGRCQYAIDHGAEGLGHCPEGKCCMPLYRAWEPK